MTEYRIEVEPRETTWWGPTSYESDARWVYRVYDGNRKVAGGPAWTKLIATLKARVARMSVNATDRRRARAKRRVDRHAANLAKIARGN